MSVNHAGHLLLYQGPKINSKKRLQKEGGLRDYDIKNVTRIVWALGTK